MARNQTKELLSELARQIVLTLTYSAQFGQPLSLVQLHQRLVRPSRPSAEFGQLMKATQNVQIKLIQSALLKLHQLSLIAARDGLFTITTHHKDLLLAAQKQQIAQKKLRQASQVGLVLGIWPWVRAVYVSGSVAASHANLNDDIDFFLVVRPHSLWLTRPVVVALAWLLGHRRSWSREEPSSWCFNMWCEDQSLVLPRPMHSLYTAYELLQLQMVSGELGCQLIWQQNGWMKSYLPFYQERGEEPGGFVIRLISNFRELLTFILTPIVWPLNQLAFFFQSIYMRAHQTREVVHLDRAFFHPRETKRIIYHRWYHQLQELMGVVDGWGVAFGFNQPSTTKVYKVLVTGVFDLLHSEHRQFLRKAKKLGEKLVVGVESDARVRRLKGQGRPIQSEQKRARVIRDTRLVDEVIILPEEFDRPQDHLKLLKKIKPNVLAVSSHTPFLAAKRSLMKQVGGRVEIVHQHNPRVSTTKLIKSARSHQSVLG